MCPELWKSYGWKQKHNRVCPPAPECARLHQGGHARQQILPGAPERQRMGTKPTEMYPFGTFRPHQAPSVWTGENNFLSASTKDTIFVDKSRLQATNRPLAVSASTKDTLFVDKSRLPATENLPATETSKQQTALWQSPHLQREKVTSSR